MHEITKDGRIILKPISQEDFDLIVYLAEKSKMFRGSNRKVNNNDEG